MNYLNTSAIMLHSTNISNATKHLKVATFEGSFESNTFIYALIGTAFENPGYLFHKDKFYFLNSVCLVEGTNCITAYSKTFKKRKCPTYICLMTFVLKYSFLGILKCSCYHQ